MHRPNDWTEEATGTAAAATATRAAETNGRHVVREVAASFGAAQIALLTVKRGTTTVFQQYVHDGARFPIDVRGNLNEAVSAELAAGAAGVVGRVSIIGYTE